MRETELTLFDLKQVITEMHPIKVFVNNILVWDDDVDLTNMTSYAEAVEAIAENKKKYEDIFSKPNYVLAVNFEIVDYHHSIVRVTTFK